MTVETTKLILEALTGLGPQAYIGYIAYLFVSLTKLLATIGGVILLAHMILSTFAKYNQLNQLFRRYRYLLGTGKSGVLVASEIDSTSNRILELINKDKDT